MAGHRQGRGLQNAGYVRQRRSFGLVAVLLLLVLVTALVTTLLFLVGNERTANSDYAEQAQAQEMAEAGIQTMIADLQLEMQAGSTVITDANGGQAWLPTSAATMRIMPISNAAAAFNHLRPSVPFTPSEVFTSPDYTGTLPFSRASDSSTTSVSQNGRSIPYPAFWDRAYLYDTNLDTTAQEPAAPDWIYIQRSGVSTGSLVWNNNLKNRSMTNSVYVLGRYAYQLYDAGGLLDLNAAGGPGGLSAAATRALEGTLAGIDLTQFPNVSAANVSDLIQFRNSTAQDANDYVNSITNTLTATNGFMTTAPGNNRFLSRGDLIRFAQKEGFTEALPYFTHFSRDVNVPSWEPRYDGPAGYQYLSTATNTTATNRFFANVTSAGESQPYYPISGAPPTNITIAAGQPRMWKRFPLARIDWLRQVQAGTASATLQQAVFADFGLSWNTTSGRWLYSVTAGATAPDSTIRTLDEIPAGQAPNFFELLKAGVLTGSLGWPRDPSVALEIQTYNNTAGDLGSTAPPYLQDPNLDYHILKIGACVIDQYSSTPTPTAIDFDYVNPVGTDPSKNLTTAQWNQYYRVPATGIKDLPYLYVISQFATLLQDSTQTLLTQEGWVQFELWNPHQQNPNSAAVPAGVQISSGGPRVTDPPSTVNTGGPVFTGGFSNDTSTGGTGNLSFSSTGLAATGRTIAFNTSNLSNYRASPAMFMAADAGTGGTENPLTWVLVQPDSTPLSPRQVGFYLGSAQFQNPSVQYFNIYYIGYGGVDSAQMVPDGVPIQLQTESGNLWTPYQVVNPHPFSGHDQGLEGPAHEGFNHSGGGFNTPISAFIASQGHGGVTYNSRGFLAVDPRTTRGQWVDSNGSQDGPSGGGTPIAANFLYGNGLYNPTLPGTSQSDADGFLRTNDIGNVTLTRQAGIAMADRPIILARPFHTPGDMGYSFRDQPWKSVNFCSTNSADAGLLDIFSVYDDPPVTAGHINLNSASQPVIKAIIAGSTKNEISGSVFSSAAGGDADTIASAFTNWVATAPMYSRAELANFASTNTITGVITNNRKFEREGAIRALSGVGQTRTIVLLLDIVAQAGQYGPTAASLNDFHVSAQVHYWAHIAIDRYTGQIVDLQLEPVYE
jgi:hypothetical protein